jgi:hypothetical protein
VGSMDHSVLWDEETAAAVVHHMECTFAASR